ncbi:MAG: hypothetical protein KBT02_13530 [Treponema sp.]|nr:hypothetical protein [Candidatus Treponema caballi]
MMQVYFLSVLFNAAAGLILITGERSNDTLLSNKSFRLVTGICTLVTGFLKLFIIAQPDIIILGDLLPAVAGLAGGANILIDYYREYTTVEISLSAFFHKLFITGRKYVGIICIIISVLHFLFPRLSIL